MVARGPRPAWPAASSCSRPGCRAGSPCGSRCSRPRSLPPTARMFPSGRITPLTLRRLSGIDAAELQPPPVGVELLGGGGRRGRRSGVAGSAPPISMHLASSPTGGPGSSTPAPKPQTRLTTQVGGVGEGEARAGVDVVGVVVAGPGDDHAPVGEQELVGVVVEVLVADDLHRARAPAVGGRRVELDVGVVRRGPAAGLVPAGGDQHPAVGQARGRRVPAAVAHVRALGPGLGDRVEEPDLLEALEGARLPRRLVLEVAAHHEHAAVGEQGLAGAPDVRGHVAAHAGAGDRVPDHDLAGRRPPRRSWGCCRRRGSSRWA